VRHADHQTRTDPCCDPRIGDLIMSGSFTTQYSVAKRDRVRAVFGDLGVVEIEFG